MTRPAAEEIAQALHERGGIAACDRQDVAYAIRAAVAERDQAWATALDRAHAIIPHDTRIAMHRCDCNNCNCATCGLCQDLAPLRSLLAAGPTTERTE